MSIGMKGLAVAAVVCVSVGASCCSVMPTSSPAPAPTMSVSDGSADEKITFPASWVSGPSAVKSGDIIRVDDRNGLQFFVLESRVVCEAGPDVWPARSDGVCNAEDRP